MTAANEKMSAVCALVSWDCHVRTSAWDLADVRVDEGGLYDELEELDEFEETTEGA